MDRILECVPNFSEGRDPSVIRAITAAIEAVEGVRLLDVDPGQATNRTVVTFVGEPEPVIEAAVRGARKAAELIDMRKHRGEHPRFGATDVCPLVPVSGLSMEETVRYAHVLARRLGEEVGLTVYCYERAATRPERANLADVRAGEYEGLAERLLQPAWKPDFGPASFQERSGATAVGARDFLVAYNVNLNTTSVQRANEIAALVREKGRVERDSAGNKVTIPGTLKCVKGIGWFIAEYGIAQISLNLTNISVTPVHVAFDEICQRANERGLRVTGSELVGLVPLKSLLDAGRYFLHKQRRSSGVSEAELLNIAVKSLGLDDVAPFDPKAKVIEYKLADAQRERLAALSVKDFVAETASESMAPGGGSISAALGALGAALASMVANLSAAKKGWEARWAEFSALAERGQALAQRLVRLIDADTAAFDGVVAARRLPKGNPAEIAVRDAALAAAVRQAIAVPLDTLHQSVATLELLREVGVSGNPASISDVGVGALAARAAAHGAHLNVRINVPDLVAPGERQKLVAEAAALAAKVDELERDVLGLVH